MRMFWQELVDFRPLNYGEDMLTGGKYLFHPSSGERVTRRSWATRIQ